MVITVLIAVGVFGLLILLELSGIQRKLDRMAGLARASARRERHMAGELDVLVTEVAETKTVIDSAVVLINNISQQLKDALASEDWEVVAALTAELDSKTNELAAAVAANTTP